MHRTAFLLVALALVGCGTNDRALGPPPPPEDSGADRATGAMRPAAAAEGRGHPDRLEATWQRAVRGDAEVRVEAAGGYGGEDLVVTVSVKNRNPEKPFEFAAWGETGRAVLKGANGRVYARVPLAAELEALLREWTEGRTDIRAGFGSGPVTHDRLRVTFIAFDRSARAAEHLDLDLDGGGVGSADPIQFRIPKDAWADSKRP